MAALAAGQWKVLLAEAKQVDGSPRAADMQLLFGVDYYPDQTPESLWAEDVRMIADYGCTNVRMAEFAWSLMEPAEGRYEMGWLERVVGMLHAKGVSTILGTPSAAPPPWLTQKYPEVMEVNDQGVTLSPGTRRFTCPTNAMYRRLSVNVATAMAEHFAKTPGVIGWQIDNEFTLAKYGRCYCTYCRKGFQQWVRTRYTTLDKLNSTWGTSFWSQVYTDWSQIPVPLPSGSEPNPGLALDYDRYQSYANAGFSAEQVAVLRRLCRQHFITTNNVGLSDTIDLRELYRGMDFASNDNYPGFFQMMSVGQNGKPASADAVAAASAFGHDFMRGVLDGKPFLVMEEQTGKAGQPTFSPQPRPEQLRLWSYQAVAHGAMGINYFRWDTADSGAEEYWHGLLRHDRAPSIGYEEIRKTMAELKSLGPELLNGACVADLALCFDYAADWAQTIQPGQPKLRYMSESSSWYGALAATHGGIDIVDARGDLSRYRMVAAPLMYVVDEEQAKRIRSYVEQGGTFVAGFRLGVKDSESRIVATPLPGLLREVMGVTVEDYVPIYGETVGGETVGGDPVGVQFRASLAGAEGHVERWADLLKPDGADVLATYTGSDYADKAAITMHRMGKGRAIYIGADLDAVSLGRVLAALAVEAGVPHVEVPRGVERTRRRAGSIEWTFLLNHTAEEQRVVLGKTMHDVIGAQSVTDAIKLAPYGVSVLRPA